ncbi:DNA recombination protein RmuC [Bifidobacterium simiarum]|uniref:DNA recombination protein RmuC n=1 Tax=Bifidobacterium simiarum TaxID=2045441 RepID=UPI001BDC7790|nr:DNA recombination protein RmuC [Bifidobacterium simiarum]MBT1165524.1 DNA recombination protein RmuC [Bifidobacterium simiarum]
MFENIAVIVALVIGLALGLAVGMALGRARAHEGARDARNHEAEEARVLLNQTNARLGEANQRVAEYRTQAEGLADQLAYVKSQLAQSQQAEQMRIQHERDRAVEREEQRRMEQERSLEEQSKVLSALAPVQKNLDALQRKVAEIEEGRRQEMGALGAQLKGLGDQQTRLGKETSSLAAALRNNKVRGAWGEAQLRNIVESAGLLEHVDFDVQVVVDDGDGKVQRPDMIVHLPGGKTIPIDAKAPYADYQRACEIPDNAPEEEYARKVQLLKAHAKALREHVRVLSDRAYWQAFDTAPDFVIAFIPNEALLQAAMESDPSLLDDAFARKVALTSPVTLWAVLKSVAYAWQQQTLTDDAKQLFSLSRELYDRMAKVGEHASALGRSITRTVVAYNKFAGSLESRVLPTARKLHDLDQSTDIPPVSQLDSGAVNVRELTAPELFPESESRAD